jgi:hypothetical protein
VYFSTSPGGGIRSKLWKTINGTAASPAFTEITGSLPDRYYSDIAVDPTNPQRIAVSLSGFGSSHVYLSTNGGSSWTNIGAGLPDVPANTVAFDPSSPSTLYVGNDIGVFYANGVPSGPLPASYSLAWTAYNEGFTDAIMVSDLLVTPTGKIRLGSYGRGLWERDLAPNGTLPARITTWTAQRAGNANELRWETSQEVNVDRFEVEYSTDGQSFSRIASVGAAVNAQTVQSYRHSHAIGQQQPAYYRLKIVDRDGRFEYTQVLKINARAEQKPVYLYPNPTTGPVRIHLTVSSAQAVQLRILDNNGRTIRTQRVNLQAGEQEFQADLGGLPEGAYRVVLDGSGIHWTGSVIKTK